ncbi:MAG: TIGR04283 family arsenosugar biosynthesis glycosyltransferase [Boseongicola sp.]
MVAPLSVVIPTLNAASVLPETAEALMPGLTQGLIRELVVSDGGSTDDTLEIAQGLGAIIVQGPAGRGGQIARGVGAARSDWLLILHADTHLGPGWTDAVWRHIDTGQNVAGYFRLAFRAEGFAPKLVAAGANFRSRWLGLPYGDQGLLLPRRLLVAVGGVPEVPLMEDVILAGQLRLLKRPLNAEARTSAERYLKDGWGRRVACNLWTLLQFKLGASPERLMRDYSNDVSK